MAHSVRSVSYLRYYVAGYQLWSQSLQANISVSPSGHCLSGRNRINITLYCGEGEIGLEPMMDLQSHQQLLL